MENVKNVHVSGSTTNSTSWTDQDIARTLIHHVNRNSFPFVFRLPTETLQAIFIYVASESYYSEDYSFAGTQPSWINVSYVCRHWRSVALNCPTLWTFLFVVSNRWMEELLSRSKQAPLKLHLNEGGVPPDETPLAITSLEQVADHAERIRAVDLILNHLPEQLISKLFSRALLLQTAKIRVNRARREQDWQSSMSLDTPALRTLDVTGDGIPWNSFMLSGVTSLSLAYFAPHFPQNIEQFLATLSCMRDLSHLYLDYALPNTADFLSSSAFRSFRKIDLPCLSRVAISDSPSKVLALLSCINIPLQTDIRLLDYSELLSPFFARRFGTSDASLMIRSLSINFDHEHLMSVSFSVHDRYPIRYPMQESWGVGIALQVLTEYSRRMTENDHCIMTILRTVPLMDIHGICVLQPGFSSTFWPKLLGHLPNLRHLQLSHGYLPELAAALSLSPSTDDKGEHLDPPQMPVPKLETLSLIEFSSGVDSLDSDVTPKQPAKLQALVDALATRESPGQLTMGLCRCRVIGTWGGGHFQFADEE